MQKWNKFSRGFLVLSLLVGLCAGIFVPRMGEVEARPLAACPGGTITQWTFFDSLTSTPTTLPSTGAGTFANGSGVNLSFVGGNPDSAISFTGWAAPFDPNDYVEFAVDTTIYSDIGISFDYRSTATGPINLDLQYSTDGLVFTPFTTSLLNNNSTFHNISFNLSSISGINNNLNTKFRLYGYGATSGVGTLRLDNVTISEICPPPIEILINEVAWAGTVASIDDEWIELYNTGSTPIDFSANPGWRLIADDGNPDITLSGTIGTGASGYFLLERGPGNATNLPENQTFTGALDDTNEILRLRAPDGTIIDTANSDGGPWPAGITSPASSMERVGVIPDGNLSWTTYEGPGLL